MPQHFRRQGCAWLVRGSFWRRAERGTELGSGHSVPRWDACCWLVCQWFVHSADGWAGEPPALSPRGTEARSKDRPAVGISGAPNRPEIRVKEESSGRADSGAKAAEKVCVAKGPRARRRLFFQRFAESPGKFSWCLSWTLGATVSGSRGISVLWPSAICVHSMNLLPSLT